MQQATFRACAVMRKLGCLKVDSESIFQQQSNENRLLLNIF